MTTRQTLWSTAGLLLVLGAVPACKKDKEAADTPPAADMATPPAGDPPTTPPPPAGDPSAADPTAGTEPAAGDTTAVAEMKPASGSKVAGTITFTEKDGKVEMALDLTGLTPGEHGFHIHEKGDCSAPDATSAGDHFNPDKKPHGAPDSPEHHAGDFGNITADEDGNAKTTMTVDFVSLAEGDTSAVGKALIVHEKKDDLKSQPSGNAGARIACGVIEKK
jgi:superoxide dismutase, Cu-Zn family